jgi:hypothetical protein
MGLPLSPPAADFVMEKILDEALRRLEFEVPFVKKYVDDTIMCIPTVLEEFVLTTLNGINNKLQFTLEVENEQKIPFLDMEVMHKDDGCIKTHWYRKPIAIGRLLNYESCHPMSQKIASAYGFMHRVFSLTTDCDENELHEMIKDTLRKNNFPRTLSNGLIQTYKIRRTGNRSRNNNEEKKYRSLLFVDGLSQQIKNVVKKGDPKIEVAFKPMRTVQTVYSKLKTREEKWRKSCIIYRIPCKQCRLAYIGKTRQYFRKRLQQHRTDANAVLKKGKNSEKTALTQHMAKTGHTFDFQNATILSRNSSARRLNYLEMFCIRANHCCNLRTDVSKLSVAYSGLINQVKELNKNLPCIHNENQVDGSNLG